MRRSWIRCHPARAHSRRTRGGRGLAVSRGLLWPMEEWRSARVGRRRWASGALGASSRERRPGAEQSQSSPNLLRRRNGVTVAHRASRSNFARIGFERFVPRRGWVLSMRYIVSLLTGSRCFRCDSSWALHGRRSRVPAGPPGWDPCSSRTPCRAWANESLTDQKDADRPCLLRRITGSRSRTSTAAASSRRLRDHLQRDRQPRTRRRNLPVHAAPGRVRAVMAYNWVTEAQKYIHSLGFGERGAPIDNQPQSCESTRRGRTTRSRPTIRTWSCASERAGSTTRRTAR